MLSNRAKIGTSGKRKMAIKSGSYQLRNSWAMQRLEKGNPSVIGQEHNKTMAKGEKVSWEKGILYRYSTRTGIPKT